MQSAKDPANGAASATGAVKPGIAQVSVLFSVTITLFILIGYRVQKANFYSGVLITEFGLILLPALIFLFVFRFNPKFVLRLKGTRPLNFFVIFFIMLFAIPVAGVFNLLNLFIVNSVFGKIIISQPPAATNAQELLVNILVIAGAAGLCEEFLFRGVMLRGYESFGHVRAILLTAFLFSVTHLDFQKIFGTFFLGAVIGLIVLKTGSLFCGMFAHFTNNAIAVLVTYISARLSAMSGGSGVKISQEANLNGMFSAFANMPPAQLTIVLYVYGFMFLFFFAVFVLLLFALIKINGPSASGNRGLSGTKLVVGGTGNGAGTGISVGKSIGTGNRADDATGKGATRRRTAGLLWLLPGIVLIFSVYYFEILRFS